MESLRFISNPASSTDPPGAPPASGFFSRCWRHQGKFYIAVAILVLVMATICTALPIYMCQPIAQTNSTSHRKMDNTMKITKEDGEYSQMYKICEIQNTGMYFVHGHVEKSTPSVSTKDYVVLFMKLRKERDIDTQIFTSCCPTVTFVQKVKLVAKSILYLKFNHGEPDLGKTTFHIYEM